MLCNSRDITARKRAEHAQKRRVEEQATLLREAHHRIKNHLHAVAAMLSLQRDTLADPHAITAIEQARARVQVMGSVYDKLFCSESFESASISSFLSPLIDDMLNAFPCRVPITIEKELTETVADYRTLSNMAIVVNELITNAVKHAFEGMRQGRIRVTATREDSTIILAVEDNGTGLPEPVDPYTSDSFGMLLVRTLTEQIDGRIRVSSDSGTRFAIQFPLANPD